MVVVVLRDESRVSEILLFILLLLLGEVMQGNKVVVAEEEEKVLRQPNGGIRVRLPLFGGKGKKPSWAGPS